MNPLAVSLPALAAVVLMAQQPFSARPEIDFDAVIDALKDRGQWQAVESDTEKYTFLPNDAMAKNFPPYQNGQWFYTDYGWTWRGNDPASWALDHYGFWTRTIHPSGTWTWVPGVHWLPSTVEWLESGDYVGWRPSQLDRFSNPLERETVRYGNPEEWSFVPREKLKGPLKPDDFATKEKTAELMADAIPVDHIYVSYREIGRPGPAPSILTGDPEKLPTIPVTTSLPDLRAMPESTPEGQFFVFRPDFFQDAQGIMRRVHLFLNPRTVPDEEAVKGMFKETEEQKRRRQEMTEKFESAQERERKHMERLYE